MAVARQQPQYQIARALRPQRVAVRFVLVHQHPHSRIIEQVSTPLKKCIGSPEQKYISDAGKKAPELGAFSSGIRLGWDYPP